MISAVDAFGQTLTLARVPERIVSLVPSDTFTVFALGRGERLVGRTDWCVHPQDGLDRVPAVGGTKTPRVEEVVALGPELVLANREENKARHVRQLQEAGIPVFVSQPTSVASGARHVEALGRLLGADDAAAGLSTRIRRAGAPVNDKGPVALYFVWHHPYMGIARDTFAWDALRATGFRPWAPAGSERYPTLTDEAIAASQAEVVLFPSEPFEFTDEHVAEFAARFPDLPAVRRDQLIRLPGEHATWHGAWSARGLAALRALRERSIKWR